MLFTGLEDYKARGTQASPYFTASFYTEFAESKDLVLIRGDIVFTSKLTDEEAKWLLEITQSFYLNDKLHSLLTKSLSIFGEKTPPELLEELIGIIEGQADLDAGFDVSDADDIDRLISCLFMALPFFCGMTIFHNVCALQLQEERKLDLLKALAEILPYTTPQDSRQILPSIVQLLKSSVEDLTRATVKKLTLGMAENNKAIAAAKSDEAKDSIKTQKQNTTTGLQTCNNILAMTRVDRSENCLLVDSCHTVPAANVSNNLVTKKGRGAGGMQNQLVNRALDGISFGGRGGRRGRGRSWGWAGRGRGRGYL
ncbi:hypothetical protein Golax_007947 [Gossypium laxum]|uniref:Uncharacterized protein n=1 Tax=Gossypium laxum TaxID=34288 RepID=A0A7J9A8D8_9ROSI|nr:hypothetical protein [Gossypium laxum]